MESAVRKFRIQAAGLLISAVMAFGACMPVGAAVTADPSAAARLRASSEGAVQRASGLQWKKVGGNLRLQNADGSYRKGFVKYKGTTYYFNSKGNLVTGFFTSGGRKYYASAKKGAKGKGAILTGLIKIGQYYYYLDPKSTPHPGAAATGFKKLGGRKYYFHSNGHMAQGWFEVSGDTYYACCNPNNHLGSLLTGSCKVGNDKCEFDSEGRLVKRVSTAKKSGTSKMHVIDVSEHQGSINFSKVRKDGVRAVIIRAGYGRHDVDDYFHENIKKARNAGLSIGIYWFSYAATKDQAVKEAKKCLNTIKGYRIELPVYFDWEYDSMNRTKVHSRSRITEMTQAFCKTIRQGGRRAGYYFNLHYRNNYYYPQKLSKYSTWYAYWGKNKPADNIWKRADEMTTPTQYDLWQFSSKGRISGISGDVDCDLLLNPSILK